MKAPVRREGRNAMRTTREPRRDFERTLTRERLGRVSPTARTKGKVNEIKPSANDVITWSVGMGNA